MINKYHSQLLREIQNEAKNKPVVSKLSANYSGSKTSIKSYNLSSPQLKNIAKEFYIKNKELEFDDFINLLDSMYVNSESTSEKYIASYLLGFYKNYLPKIPTNKIDYWLSYLTGWAEIDSLCQPYFTGTLVLSNFKDWETLLKNLNKSENISKRRASLVLLTKPVNNVKSAELLKISFKNIQNLKSEKDILITKAISWLLRSMVKNYKDEVKDFIKENYSSLPKIAIRETTRKIETGRK